MAESAFSRLPLSPVAYLPAGRNNQSLSPVRSPASVGMVCFFHREQAVEYFCSNCSVLLCASCLSSRPPQHMGCTIEHLNHEDNAHLCDRVKHRLSTDILNCKKNLTTVHRNLLAKQQRLLRKKEETATEIQRYFTDLRSKISAKLNEREQELMEQLSTAVSAQHDAVKDYIGQCEAMNHTLQQNKAMVDNLEQIYKMRGGNSIEHLRKLIEVSNQIDQQNNNSPSIDAARDFFLVIRFFIDTEIERTFLNANIACVEVVNSVDGASDASLSQNGSREELDSLDHPESEASSAATLPVIPPRTHTPHSDSELELSNIALGGLTVQLPEVTSTTGSSNNDPQPESAISFTLDETSDRDMLHSPNSDSSMSSYTSVDSDDIEPPPPYPGMPSVAVPSDEIHDPPPPYPGLPSYSPPRERSRRTTHRPPRPPPPAVQIDNPPQAGPAANQPRRQSSVPFGKAIEQGQEANNIRARGPFHKFSASEVNDQRSCGIVAMVTCRNNRLLIIDRWNKKLKYFSETGVSYGGLIFREEPWDIASMLDDNFAVTVPSLSIIYKVKATTEQVLTTRRIDTPNQYACVAYHAQNDMFVCGQVPQFGEPLVDIISANGGQSLLQFRLDIDRNHMFSYPRYVQVSNDGTAVVCDWNMKALVLFKLDGGFIGRYKGSTENPLNDPTGIFLNKSSDKIYVIDGKTTSTSGSIHRLSLDGQCTANIVGQKYFRDARAILVVGHKIFTGSNKGIVNCFVRTRDRSSGSNRSSRSSSVDLSHQGSAV